ncbi:MAG: hypothetical protein ABI613_06690 [Gemmatimonadota bacterium]
MTRLSYCAALGLALVVIGCGPDAVSRPTTPPPITTTLGIAMSDLSADPGDTVGIALTIRTGELPPVGAVQGYLHFDADRLEYLGQIAGRTFAITNDARVGEGALRIAALDIAGLPERAAFFLFRVKEKDYISPLSFTPEGVADRRGNRLGYVTSSAVLELATDLPLAGALAHISLTDWRRLLSADYPPARTPPFTVPGEYRLNLRYGDVTLDGLIDIIGDAFYLANVGVGNAPLIAGTDAPSRDAVIAGNVDPANLPGLGEPGDALPPGRNADGTYSIDIFDAAIVANEAVGNNPPVAGEIIPGRGAAPSNRVVINSNVLAGTARTLTADTIYELQGMVNVEGTAVLTIEAGTRIEGDVATRGALVVRRGGVLNAIGTRLQPIVFTCTAAIKSRGCWGGVALHGFSLLNNGEILPGGIDVNGCPQKVGPIDPGYYGGCLVQNNSGVLRFVRIEYAGMSTAGNGPVPGLALLGVGSATQIDSVQVYASLGDGVYLSGGTVNLRYLLSTNNAADGLRWEDGWVGKGQFLIVQQDADNDHAIHGTNFAVNPNAGPRSSPQLYNLTVSGPPLGMGASGDGILLDNGTAAVIQNAIVFRAGTDGLDIQGAESCALANAGTPGILVAHSIFFGSPNDFSSDADCVDESAYALAPSLGNRVIDPALESISSTMTPDFRPLPGSPALTGFATPPSDGFFDLSANYIGAVAPATALMNNIPWFSGWTRGWTGAP